MALVTALTLGSLSAGVLLSRPDRPWVRTAFGGGEAGAVTRHLLPAVVAVPLVLGWLELYAVRNGVMEAETGTALLVIVLVAGLAGLTLRLARNVDRRVATELSLRDTLQGMNDTFQLRVDERTRELTEAQAALLQSQKMDAVGQLTGGVAHDFNNLLTIIRSSVEFLRRPDLTEERRGRYMDAVSDTVDRAAKLTAQLLAFARRQALRPEVFDVGARVRSVADMLDSLTGARIRIVTHLPVIACHVRADVSQFETALVNLAVNARDAMGGEGTLTIRVACDRPMPAIRGHAASSGTFISIEVSDTGSGIPAENLGPIFEPFFTTKDIGKGTGLGLSQVIGFTKQSGGDVDVGSVVGQGTTFTLYLPQADVEPDAAGIDVEPEAAAADRAGRCILVVEDNVEVGQFCAQVLHDLGYGTVLAHSAEVALAEIEAVPSRFDAVFSDVVMPGIGGIELANRLRERHPDLPVILTSGYSHVLAQDGAHGFDLVPGVTLRLQPTPRTRTGRRCVDIVTPEAARLAHRGSAAKRSHVAIPQPARRRNAGRHRFRQVPMRHLASSAISRSSSAGMTSMGTPEPSRSMRGQPLALRLGSRSSPRNASLLQTSSRTPTAFSPMPPVKTKASRPPKATAREPVSRAIR
jgi:signal transduction histidine kinase/CheY-like chemotaxis protein